MRWSKVVLLCLLLVCAFKSVVHLRRPTLEDFRVYETAALLVHEHHSLWIYNGADTGVDPQVRYADPQSIFAREAAKLGIAPVRMYVYPPVLADVLVPLGYLRARLAGEFWIAVNLLVLMGFCALCMGMLNIPWRIAGIAALVVGTATYYPVLDCLHWGQITIVLLGLWTLGVYGYVRGWMAVSAFALALATSIKLTPLLAIVPFILWKEWRWLRAYVVSMLALLAGVWAVNGSACIEDYFQHVVPSMANGNISLANRSIVSSMQLVYLTWKGFAPDSAFLPVSHTVGVVGKAVSLIFLLAAAALVARYRANSSPHTRIVVLSLFPLLSVLASPVSWGHAYVVCLLTFAVLWAEALQERVPRMYLALLAVSSLELNWFQISFTLRRYTHGLAFGLSTSVPVICGIVLVMYRLAAIPRFAGLASQSLPASRELAA